MAKSTTQTAKQKLSNRPARVASSAKLNEQEQKIVRALEIEAQMKQYKEELDEIKGYFEEYLSDDKTNQKYNTAFGSVERSTTNTYSIDAKHVPVLKETFGSAYKAYVKEKFAYSPEPAMRKLLLDADYEHSEVIREAVKITTYNSIRFKEAV